MAAPTRVRLCSTFLISLALLAIDNSSADITPVWLASDEGMAIVECEDTHRILDGSSWSFQESPEGFLGQGALKHRGGAFETTSLLYHLHLEKNETCAFTLRASTSAPAETVMARLTDEDHRTLEFRSTGTEGWTLLSASPGILPGPGSPAITRFGSPPPARTSLSTDSTCTLPVNRSPMPRRHHPSFSTRRASTT